jgi:hypothetical protein
VNKPEHADLLLDVRPLARSIEVDKRVVQLITHADDAVGHALDLGFPLAVELGIAEDGAGNAGTMERRVRVHRTDDDLELRLDASLLLRVGSHDRERADTLAVETHVLREGLAKSDLVALRHEVARSERVERDIAGGEALVGHVEEGEELLLLEEGRELLPLSLGRIDTSRVVSTGVEKDNSILRGVLPAL